MQMRSWFLLMALVCLGFWIGRIAGWQPGDSRPLLDSVANSSGQVYSVARMANVPISGRMAPPLTESMSLEDLISVAQDVYVEPGERNLAMDRLMFQLPKRDAIAVFHRLALSKVDADVYRSWSVQHLGMATKDSRDEEVALEGLSLLRSLAQENPEGTLVRREALYALLTIGKAKDLGWIADLTRKGLSGSGPDRDLWARFAGMLHLTDQIPKLQELSASKEWALRMSAINALTKITDNSGSL